VNVGAFVNHNSYAILAGGLLLFAAWSILRGRVSWRRILAFGAIAAALVLPSLYVRSTGAPATALDAALGSGRPTLLEVYSPY
jgi:hypothetical protein